MDFAHSRAIKKADDYRDFLLLEVSGFFGGTVLLDEPVEDFEESSLSDPLRSMSSLPLRVFTVIKTSILFIEQLHA